MFAKVCQRFNKIPAYTTVTLLDHDEQNNSLLNVKEYFDKNGWIFNILDCDSQLDSTLEQAKSYSDNYNFVFIDADHRYEFCKRDFSLYTPLADNTLIFHDVKPRVATSDVGVWQAICDSGIIIDEEFTTNDINYGLGLKYVDSDT